MVGKVNLDFLFVGELFAEAFYRGTMPRYSAGRVEACDIV